MQRAGQAEFLVRVLGAVTQPPERVVYLPVCEFYQVKGVGDEGDAGRGAGTVGGGQVHRQVPQSGGVPGEQVLLRGGGTALGQAQGAAAAEIDQVGEPFGAGPGDLAGLRVRAVGGGAPAELIDPGCLDWLLPFVQVSELLIGVGGEGAGGGAVRDAVAARRGGGRHQVIADRLAEPGPQPAGQPGPVLDGGQPLGESPLLATRGVAVPAGLVPGQQDLPVADVHVAGRGPGPLLDPRRRRAAPRAAARGLGGWVGDHLDQSPPVLGLRRRRDQQPGNPQQDRRCGARSGWLQARGRTPRGRARWIIMSARQDRERGLASRCGVDFTCLMTGVENGLGPCSNVCFRLETPFMVSARTPAFPVCRRCGLDLAVPHELNLCRHRRLVGRGHNCPKLSPVVQRARPEVSDIQASGDVGQCCTWQRSPAVALGLKHHSRRAVAVQNGRDDASVQIAEAVVMLGPRHERRCHNPIARVAAELQSLRVAWPAAEAAQARIQPFLDAAAMADPTGSHKVSVPRVAATSGQAPRSRAAQAQHSTGPATYLGTRVGDPVRADARRSNAGRAALARPGPLPAGHRRVAGEGGRRIPAGTPAG